MEWDENFDAIGGDFADDQRLVGDALVRAAALSGGTEVDRLQRIIERERSAAVTWINRARAEVKARRLPTTSRGSYSWDDDEYRKEFGRALDAVEKVLASAEKETGARDLTDCPTTQAEVNEARAALRGAAPPSEPPTFQSEAVQHEVQDSEKKCTLSPQAVAAGELREAARRVLAEYDGEWAIGPTVMADLRAALARLDGQESEKTAG